MSQAALEHGDTVYVVDPVQQPDGSTKKMLCRGTVNTVDWHRWGKHVAVEWTDPKRETSPRQLVVLSTDPRQAIEGRSDLSNDEIQEITADAKSRGLLN